MSGKAKRPRMDLAMPPYAPENLTIGSHPMETGANRLLHSVIEENQQAHRNTPRLVDAATKLAKARGI